VVAAVAVALCPLRPRDLRYRQMSLTPTLSGRRTSNASPGPLELEVRRPCLRDGINHDLLYDPIRPLEYRLGNRHPEPLRRLEVDHQFELRGLLNGQVDRLRALENLHHLLCRPTGQIGTIRPVAHQTTRLWPDRRLGNRWEPSRGGVLEQSC